MLEVLGKNVISVIIIIVISGSGGGNSRSSNITNLFLASKVYETIHNGSNQPIINSDFRLTIFCCCHTSLTFSL